MATLSLKRPSTRVRDKKPVDTRARINQQRQAKYDKAQQWLSREYPVVFNLFKPLPLAIGCGPTIIKSRPDDISSKTMVRCLNRWTRRQAYQNAVATGDFRYRLDGTPTGSISDAHRRHAREQLEK